MPANLSQTLAQERSPANGVVCLSEWGIVNEVGQERARQC